MRRMITIAAAVLAACGCTERETAQSPPAPQEQSPQEQATGAPEPVSVAYDPATFRADVERFVSAKQYRHAVALVKAADVDRQLAADGGGYLAVGFDNVLLPGVHQQIEYDPARDWYFPDTQDAIFDWEWQAAATEFAERYNLRRRRLSNRPL